ncbi:alpha-tocopherol transfer protein-like [Pectinophora gossypiella]|uniref:alpha-tocopherol transfer protein-like n=1 Tax=Pectinophora gossypiella TaxID=13191 RepID=UPI00214E9D45|nr:alpha-tocopherol transfer protein-like [Pectinophora gossypiella]XP_049887072.1 alpha-tocopherol transfer protein-like [Pectinophora gossypiella]
MDTVKQIPLEEEYKKNTGVTPEDVSKLREWMDTQPHLPGQYITDLDLILAHHCCDCDLEASKRLLDTHFTLKTEMTSLFKDRAFDERIERALNTSLLIPLPTPSKDGYAVFYTRTIDSDPQNYCLQDLYRATIMGWELWQVESGTWPGFVMVFDLAGLGFQHFLRMHLSSLQNFTKYMQEAFLGKLKYVHILNAPSFFDKIVMLCRPFVKSYLLEMIRIHHHTDTLEEFYPVEALPVESGGRWKRVLECRDEVIAKFRANAKFFDAEAKKRVDESKRPRKPSSQTSYGFFDRFRGVRKVEID